MEKKSFLVLGAGRFGISVAENLERLGQEVCIVDENVDVIQNISNKVTHAVIGDCCDEEVLRSVGAENFDSVIIALSENMQVSILVTVTLKELGVKHVMARAGNELHKKILEKVGADEVLMPEQQMGNKLAHNLASANHLSDLELTDEFSIVKLVCPSKWVGKNPVTLDVRNKYGINVVAVQRGEDIRLEITGEDKFLKGDVLVVAGRNEDIEALK